MQLINEWWFLARYTDRSKSEVSMDEALTKTYSNPSQFETVCKWNIIKHGKIRYKSYLHELHHLHDDDEYRQHHKYLKSTTKGNKKCIIDTSDTNLIIDIITRSQVDIESSAVLR